MQPKTGTGKYERLLERCAGFVPIPTAVAYPCESTSLSGPIEAAKKGERDPIRLRDAGLAALGYKS